MFGRKKNGDDREKKAGLGTILKSVLYGMVSHDEVSAALRTRMHFEHVFMFVTLGDMLGIPILPPYYSLRVLPYAVPNIDTWKRRVFRERDIF
ncbi:hypothetical protein [Caldinitratiruptor microaerophilus]|uniref:Uncharacterized protein n=1 Tax=Caldinitratiruptor microaerophilus TaxID=671077 RepID=A0AA35G6E5_9FIRM|nr:hypothetical protein [Caldinitratiruptor microaerophilus]BDG61156.1 hypothetical protein caldi_22460 [Caldinitratiruptor microaerophilus]